MDRKATSSNGKAVPTARREKSAATDRPIQLFYFAPSDIQVARVDRQCVVGFCDGLQQVGVDVELVAMGIRTLDVEHKAENPLSLYRVHRDFPVRIVSVPVHQESRGWWLALNRLWVHGTSALRAIRSADPGKRTVFFTKNYSSAFILQIIQRLARRRPTLVFEAHMPPSNFFQRHVLANVDRIVANSAVLGDELVAERFARSEQVYSTHQGINLDVVESERVSKEEARRALGLPLDRRLAVYTGKIYDGYKEVEYIVEAARLLKDRKDLLFVMVGGRADHAERLGRRMKEQGIDNVIFTGFVPQTEVQNYQLAADLLMMYYPSEIALNKYRSPGKLFDYMAAGRPIISSDLQCVREVLGEDPAGLLIAEDSPKLLSEAIERLLDDPALAESLAARALERVAEYTWEKRGERIVNFINEQKG